MTCKEIIEQYLKEKGFDGLCGDDCGCGIDDLMPCFDAWTECVPGFKGPDPDGESDWLMYPSREAVAEAKSKVKAAGE